MTNRGLLVAAFVLALGIASAAAFPRYIYHLDGWSGFRIDRWTGLSEVTDDGGQAWKSLADLSPTATPEDPLITNFQASLADALRERDKIDRVYFNKRRTDGGRGDIYNQVIEQTSRGFPAPPAQ